MSERLLPHELAHLDQGNVLVRMHSTHRYTITLMWLTRGTHYARGADKP
jgi:hypothetical protein